MDGKDYKLHKIILRMETIDPVTGLPRIYEPVGGAYVDHSLGVVVDEPVATETITETT